jgi:ATP-dependent protease HslVU (ClpYQ) peptidase subunit
MSIVCATVKRGEIAIAADTVTKYGSLSVSSAVQADSSKLYEVNDSVIGIVGWCSVSIIIEHLVKNEAKLFRLHDRMEILSTMLLLHERMKDEFYLNTYENRDQAVESSQLHLMIANPHGLFMVSSGREVAEFKTFFSMGSGSRIGLGAMHALYNSRRSARSIAEAGVQAAAAFDDCCGLPLESRVVQLAGESKWARARRGSTRRFALGV